MFSISVAKETKSLLLCLCTIFVLLALVYAIVPTEFAIQNRFGFVISQLGILVFFGSFIRVPRQSRFLLLYKLAILLLCCGIFATINFATHALRLVFDISISRERTMSVASIFNVIGLLSLVVFWLLHLVLGDKKRKEKEKGSGKAPG